MSPKRRSAFTVDLRVSDSIRERFSGVHQVHLELPRVHACNPTAGDEDRKAKKRVDCGFDCLTCNAPDTPTTLSPEGRDEAEGSQNEIELLEESLMKRSVEVLEGLANSPVIVQACTVDDSRANTNSSTREDASKPSSKHHKLPRGETPKKHKVKVNLIPTSREDNHVEFPIITSPKAAPEDSKLTVKRIELLETIMNDHSQTLLHITQMLEKLVHANIGKDPFNASSLVNRLNSSTAQQLLSHHGFSDSSSLQLTEDGEKSVIELNSSLDSVKDGQSNSSYKLKVKKTLRSSIPILKRRVNSSSERLRSQLDGANMRIRKLREKLKNPKAQKEGLPPQEVHLLRQHLETTVKELKGLLKLLPAD